MRSFNAKNRRQAPVSPWQALRDRLGPAAGPDRRLRTGRAPANSRPLALELDPRALTAAWEGEGRDALWRLDLESGEIFPLSPSNPLHEGRQAQVEEEPDRYLDLQRPDQEYWLGVMHDFLGTLEAEPVGDALARALDAQDPAPRAFHFLLAERPDLAARWEAFKIRAVAASAGEWLDSLGIPARFKS